MADSSESDIDQLLPLITEATAGEYEILGELGRGGMAAVYLARDLSLNRKVVIKTMLPELIGRGAMVQRFKREAQMAAGLSHPHIVQIHTVKQTPKIVYFVMKFIEGRGLDSIIAQHGALDVDMTRLVLQQAASALSFAHHRGVVHRDVKPANIMIDENGWAVMTDFGIAKMDDGQNLTATGTSVGTPHYMAPEQFHNKELTASADQYALGVVAYEMLTGKKPFDGNSLAEIITQHLFKEPTDLQVNRADLPPTISAAILRMLAKEPAQRFPDLDAAIASLGAPDPANVDAARGRLMSLARSSAARAPRLSVPMSPVPATRPSAPTTVVNRKEPVEVSDSGAILMSPKPVAREEHTPMPAPITPASAPAMAKPRRAEKKSHAIHYMTALVVLLLIAGVIGALRMRSAREARRESRSLQRGVVLYQQGQAVNAGAEFTIAAREMPASAMPHVYLSRLARERGDLATAFNEAAAAVRLEPNNGVALRETGAVLLARGDNDTARKFYVRALKANPADKAAMGWLACSFHRMGYNDEAARWSQRAGAGDWSSCLQ